jgi:hypothetical protein
MQMRKIDASGSLAGVDREIPSMKRHEALR